MGTHSHDQKLVKSYHTPSHHPICGTGAALPGKEKAFPVQQCKLSTMQALAGTHPACAGVQQAGKSQKKPCLTLSLVCPQPQPEVPWTVPITCSRRAHSQPPGMGQAGTAAQSQVGLGIPFLPPLLPNTGLHLADTTEKREQTPPGHSLISPC